MLERHFFVPGSCDRSHSGVKRDATARPDEPYSCFHAGPCSLVRMNPHGNCGAHLFENKTKRPGELFTL